MSGQAGPPLDAAGLSAQLQNASTAPTKQAGDASWISYMSEEQLVRELEIVDNKIPIILDAYQISREIIKDEDIFVTFGKFKHYFQESHSELDSTINQIPSLSGKDVTNYVEEYENFFKDEPLKTEMLRLDDYRRNYWNTIKISDDPTKQNLLNMYIAFDLFHRYLARELDKLHKRYVELVDKYLVKIQKVSPYLLTFPKKETLRELLENNPTKPDLILWRSMIDSLFQIYKINENKQEIKLDPTDELFIAKKARFEKNKHDSTEVKTCLTDSIELVATKQLNEFIQLYTQPEYDDLWGWRGNIQTVNKFLDGIKTFVLLKAPKEKQLLFKDLGGKKQEVAPQVPFFSGKTSQRLRNAIGYGKKGGKLKKLTLKKKRLHR